MKRYRRKGPMDEVVRVRLPEGNQTIGVVESALGGLRFRVVCEDGKVRVCRIPGRLTRRLYIRPEDVVLVEPWEIQGDKRGDIIWRYRDAEINWLRKNGHLTLI